MAEDFSILPVSCLPDANVLSPKCTSVLILVFVCTNIRPTVVTHKYTFIHLELCILLHLAVLFPLDNAAFCYGKQACHLKRNSKLIVRPL